MLCMLGGGPCCGWSAGIRPRQTRYKASRLESYGLGLHIPKRNAKARDRELARKKIKPLHTHGPGSCARRCYYRGLAARPPGRRGAGGRLRTQDPDGPHAGCSRRWASWCKRLRRPPELPSRPRLKLRPTSWDTMLPDLLGLGPRDLASNCRAAEQLVAAPGAEPPAPEPPADARGGRQPARLRPGRPGVAARVP